VIRLIEDEKTLAGFAGSELLMPDFEQRFNAAMNTLRDAERRRDDATFEIERLGHALSAVPRDVALAIAKGCALEILGRG